MLPIKPGENKNNIRVETGDKLLRETLATTHQALRGVANENKKLNQEVTRLKKQRALSSVGSILLLLASLSWFVYTTYLYIKQHEVNTPIGLRATTLNTHRLPLPKTTKKTVKTVGAVRVKKQNQATVVAKKHSVQVPDKAFTPNELLEARVAERTRKSIKDTLRLHSPISFTTRNAVVVTFTRSDSSKWDKPATIIIRSNNILEKPVRKMSITDFESIVLYKDNFKPGLYYVEIMEGTESIHLSKFVIK